MKKIFGKIALVVLVIFGAYIIFTMFNNNEISRLSKMSSEEYIQQAIKKLDDDSIITIGIYDKGQKQVIQYDKNGKVSYQDRLYEIASITKTMTAEMIYDLVKDGKISLDDSLDKYIDLPEGNYPKIFDLITHTAGYKRIYQKGKNFNLSNQMKAISDKDLKEILNKNHPNKHFEYSNFSYGLLGKVIEKATGKSYQEKILEYLRKKDMTNSDLESKLDESEKSGFFDWGLDNFYSPAGEVVAKVGNLMKYLESSITNFDKDNARFTPLYHFQNQFTLIKNFGIDFTAICYGWLIDESKNICAHPGELPTSTAFIGFNPYEQKGIIVLIDQQISNGLNAKFLGGKMLSEMFEK